jgi:hypothetical protein
MRTPRFATPTFREAACCVSTPPDAFTVTDRRFTSNADRRIVAERRREFSEQGEVPVRIVGPLHFTVIWGRLYRGSAGEKGSQLTRVSSTSCALHLARMLSAA